jgi:hypothetical protein
MKKYNELENMMLNIVDFGAEQMYNEIEDIIDPIKRFNQRHTFFNALEKLNANDQEN